MRICEQCGERLKWIDGSWTCTTCEPSFGERLADGFALLNASEDSGIDSDKHI